MEVLTNGDGVDLAFDYDRAVLAGIDVYTLIHLDIFDNQRAFILLVFLKENTNDLMMNMKITMKTTHNSPSGSFKSKFGRLFTRQRMRFRRLDRFLAH